MLLVNTNVSAWFVFRSGFIIHSQSVRGKQTKSVCRYGVICSNLGFVSQRTVKKKK